MPQAVAMELECRDVGSLTGREGACQRFSRGGRGFSRVEGARDKDVSASKWLPARNADAGRHEVLPNQASGPASL